MPDLDPSEKRFCSYRCSKRNRRRRDHKAARARVAGSPQVETLDPFEVFERDGWRCVLCRVSTPKSLVGTRHANEPTLDHIHPLKFRGHHTMSNVRLACRSCNEWRDMEMKRNRAPHRAPHRARNRKARP